MCSDLLPPVRWRSMVRPTLAVLLLLGLVEASLHVPAVRRWLPMPDPFYAPGVEARVRCIETFIARQAQPDVVFLGSSVMGAGVIPGQFDAAVLAAGGEPVLSFNLWMTGLNCDPVRLYWERFWRQRCRPRQIIQGIRLIELGAGPAETYDRFALGRIERHWIRLGRKEKVLAWLFEHMGLLYYSGFMPAYLRDMPWPPNRARGAPLDDRGCPLRVRTEQPDNKAETDMAIYRMAHEPSHFEVGLQSLTRMAVLCREAGIHYTVVNVPEHAARYGNDEQGNALYAFYLHTMREWSRREGVRFLDITDGVPSAYGEGEFEYDLFHMNQVGAERFTRELALRWGKRGHEKADTQPPP